MPHATPPDPSRSVRPRAPVTQQAQQPQGHRWGLGAQSALEHLLHEHARQAPDEQKREGPSAGAPK